MRLMLDPGHGGADPGASSVYGQAEKDINLTIAKLIAADLGTLITTYLTRDRDITISLEDRVRKANALNVDCFVSIHQDAAPLKDPEPNGFTVIHSVVTTSRGKPLATLIAGEMFGNTPFRSRGTKCRESAVDKGKDFYYVIRHTNMPAVIVECCFLTNSQDARLISRPPCQRCVAEAIAHGILRWKQAFNLA